MKRGRFVRILMIGIAMVATALTASISSANHGECVAAGGFTPINDFGPSHADACVAAQAGMSGGVWVGFDVVNTCNNPWGIGGCTKGAHVTAPYTITQLPGFGVIVATNPHANVSPVSGVGPFANEAGWSGAGLFCVRDLRLTVANVPLFNDSVGTNCP